MGKETDMPLNDPSDILIATTPAGYREIEDVFETITSLHAPDTRHTCIPRQVPTWMDSIADELREADAESPVTAQEMAFELARDARCLRRDMRIRIMDDKGVVIGWDSVDWDPEDLVCDAVKEAISDSNHPMEFARVASMEEFEEWHNRAYKGPDDLEYSVCVEPTVAIAYPPEWHK